MFKKYLKALLAMLAIAAVVLGGISVTTGVSLANPDCEAAYLFHIGPVNVGASAALACTPGENGASIPGLTSIDYGGIGPSTPNRSSGGPTAGQGFSDSVRAQAIQDNADMNNGVNRCIYCGSEVSPGSGLQVDHGTARVNNGNATSDNANVACQSCNASKGARDWPNGDTQTRNSIRGGALYLQD